MLLYAVVFEVSAGCVWVFLVARVVDKSFVGCVL